MGAEDEPERYTFLRGGRDPRREAAIERASLYATARGAALDALMKADGLAAAIERAKAYRSRQVQPINLRPRITRGGKPVNDA